MAGIIQGASQKKSLEQPYIFRLGIIMFTGIIEFVGTVRLVRVGGAGGVVAVDVGTLVEGTKLGDSIAVDGVCLTVTNMGGTVCDFF